jgi:hypothetical protein
MNFVTTVALAPFWLVMLWRNGRYGILVLGILAPLMNSAAFGQGGAITVPWVTSLLFSAMTLLSKESHPHARVLLRQREFQLICLVPFVNLVVMLLSQILYAGKIRVLVGDAAFTIGRELVLSLFPQHINQAIYSVAAPVLICAVFCRLRMQDSEAKGSGAAALLRFYVAYTVSASLIILWERVHQMTGVWYWSDMFHSTYSMTAWIQSINGVSRLSGPYPEPSNLAYHLGPLAVMFAWLGYYKSYKYILFSLLLAVIMFMSTSTTAFIGIGLVAATFGILILKWYGDGLSARGDGSAERAAISIVAAMILMVVMGFVVAQYAGFVDQVLQSVLNKQSSSSYQARSYADALGVTAFVETNGLGVGLGGHLTNSGAILVMSNLGVAGVCLVGALIVSAARRVLADGSISKYLQNSGQKSDLLFLQVPLAAMLFTFMMTHILTAPLFISPLLWVTVAVFLYVSCGIRALVPGQQSLKLVSIRPSPGVQPMLPENRGR